MKMLPKKLPSLLLLLLFPLLLNAQIKLSDNFQNGNGKLILSKNNSIFVQANLGKNQTINCWFYFKIFNFNKQQNIKLYLVNSPTICTPIFIVYSPDNTHWHKIHFSQSSNLYTLFVIPKTKADTLFIALTYPYTYNTLLTFLKSIKKNPFVHISTLTTSKHGHKVPLLTISDFSSKNNSKDLVWIIARQHAFEAPANYCLQGIIKFFISNTSLADTFRKNTIAFIVPMMDVDNVINGFSGRMQMPIDFNRDWMKNPYWNAIKATEQLIQTTSQIYNFRLFFDIHATFPVTPTPMFSFFNIYSPNSEHSKNIEEFWQIFSSIADFSPNEVRDTTKNFYADYYIKTHYPYTDFAMTVECDWNYFTPNKTWNPKLWEHAGYLIGVSIAKYLAK